MNRYEVGQILYLTNEKSFKIIPVQVVEEVVRTTIEGSYKTYHIQFPDKNKTVVDISEIKYKCFKTENEVREYLISNTKSAIEKLLYQANELKKECFANTVNIPVDKKLIDDTGIDTSVVQQKSDNDIIKVDLGNGLVGKMKKNNLNI